MVLQQNCEVPLWGWAYEGETVLIETSWGVKTQTVAAARGEWRLSSIAAHAQSAARLHRASGRTQLGILEYWSNAIKYQTLFISDHLAR
jgi:hypothetical protein